MKTWSNLAFTAPLFVAVYSGLYPMAILISTAMVVSAAYHAYGGQRLRLTDHLTAYALIFANLYLIYLFEFEYPYFSIALLFVAVAFHFYFRDDVKRQDFNHSMWHLSSAAVTLVCVLGYINYHVA